MLLSQANLIVLHTSNKYSDADGQHSLHYISAIYHMWCQSTFKNVKCRDKPNKEPLTLFPSVAFGIMCGFATANWLMTTSKAE